MILLMISLCCGSALHPATETTEILDDNNQRGGSTAVKEPSCPTWYLAVKHNGVSKCACGATLKGSVRCDDATLEALSKVHV